MKILKKFYKLKRFKKESKDLKSITAELEVIDNLIYLSFSIFGNISKIIIPDIKFIPQNKKNICYKRKNNLWKTTCFEFFLANKNSKSYFEINVSSDYYYNIYSFSDYREGMQEENSLYIKNIKEKKEKGSFLISFTIESKNKINTNNLLLNISSVIEYNNRKIEYWAMSHFKNKADFHHFDNFINF